MLKNYVPEFICTGNVFKKIYEAQQLEIDNLNLDVEDLINQCFILRATWSLSIWEEEMNIQTNTSDSYDIRRSRILAKRRGQGVCNASLIKAVTESFTNGTVIVNVDNANYTFTIKFVSTKGIPTNVEDLKTAIEEIKPAHLAVNYEYSYNTWGVVEEQCATWGDLKVWALTWGDAKVKDL